MDVPVNRYARRKRIERILYTLAALILVALVLDGVFGSHGLIATYRLRLQVRQAQQKTEQLTRENQEFAGQVRQLKSDPSAIERVAREKMGLVKPGELVFKLPAKPSANPSASPSGNASTGVPSGNTTRAR